MIVTIRHENHIMKNVCTRFSISMAADLTLKLDAMIKAKGYRNRSQAIADMVRSQLVEHNADFSNKEIAGTVTLVFDHHKRGIQSLLTGIQHDHQAVIVSTMHVHLDHHNCLEVLVMRGLARAVKSAADRLIATKGVKHGKLTLTTTGRDFGSRL